ncbi:uncharacterized protein DUF1877 [Streptomyces sp. Ag109_O5-1]|uniref:DUF1877 family protein n=1 Tax=Streptomyces sp. Ag109_O5-1 TaxID=1938851 RepID=UPI000F4F6841|nr:DUF1877 family protein [Streptomyces sp. Ag109_O5-1]RPE39998.1 uncharacterized protein DUF1877 [Streptomyces sp. Ag109_O5-1]
MSAYLRLRAVPPPALRNSATWLERLFEGDAETVRRCRDLERIYTGAPLYPLAESRPRTQVVLGGWPVFRADRHKTPLLVLTAAQARQVARFLAAADFEALWDAARDELLPRYGGVITEPETRGAFAAAHRELTAFYVHTAECGDAVVKWLSEA